MDGIDPENVKGFEEADGAVTVLEGVIGLVGCRGLEGWIGVAVAGTVHIAVRGKDDITDPPVSDPL